MLDNEFMTKLSDKQIDEEIEITNRELAEIDKIFNEKLQKITDEREQARNILIDKFSNKTQKIYNKRHLAALVISDSQSTP